MNKRKTGAERETMALEYLESEGCRVLDRNVYTRRGEIDAVVEDEDCIVFVEIKYRRTGSAGYAAEAVDARKQKRISDCARYYILSHGLSMDRPYRFDVVAIDADDVRWIRNAFERC